MERRNFHLILTIAFCAMMFITPLTFAQDANPAPRSKIYYLFGDGLYSMEAPDGRNEKKIVQQSVRVKFAALSIDPVGQKAYWSHIQRDRIYVYDLVNGGERAEIFLDKIDYVGGLLIDPEEQRLYWSNGATGEIRWTALDKKDGGEVVRLGGTTFTHGLAVDLTNRKLYTRGSLGLGYVMLDKVPAQDYHSSKELITFEERTHNSRLSIAVDPDRGKLYWMEKYKEIWQSELDGSDPVLIHETFGFLRDIAVDPRNGDLYWIDISGNDYATIRRRALDTGEVTIVSEMKSKYLGGPHALTIVVEVVAP